MAASITLRVTQGVLLGSVLAFDEANSYIMGRAKDCNLRLPNDEAHRAVSRYHCLLDVNPPAIRIRDLGSLNGTFVNGEKIGQREMDAPARQARDMKSPERSLEHGDEIRIGGTVFYVAVEGSLRCCRCSRSIAEKDRAGSERSPGVFICDSCDKGGKMSKKPGQDGDNPADASPHALSKAELYSENEYEGGGMLEDPLLILEDSFRESEAHREDLRFIQGYEIERELGRGGMGAVYLASHASKREKIALKIMLPTMIGNSQAIEAFAREVENTKALNHKNIVRFHDSGRAGNAFFFTMEYCELGNVENLVRQRGGALPLDESIRIICDVLDGLAYAHRTSIPATALGDDNRLLETGLVHRDLSPPNILLTKLQGEMVAKVSDYGLGKAFALAGLSGLTRTGTVAGKPWFMPRQQVLDFKYAKPEVDTWAAAACLYYLIAGCPPRDFPPHQDIWQSVLKTEATPIRVRDSRVPKRVAEVIDEALIDSPGIRIGSALELKKQLQATL